MTKAGRFGRAQSKFFNKTGAVFVRKLTNAVLL
jgi:hypothetical protein